MPTPVANQLTAMPLYNDVTVGCIARSSFPTLVAESSAVATVSDHCMLEVPVDISTPMLRIPLVTPHFHT